MSVMAVYMIARLEFFRLLTNKFVLAVGVFLMFVAFLLGAGGAESFASFSSKHSQDVVLVAFGSSWETTVEISFVMASFLAATSLPHESWKNSLGVLLSKPLYRRDVVLGKFMGIAGFMFLFNAFDVLFTGLMIITFYRGPLSVTEFGLRVGAYILIFTLFISIVIALNMLFGAISKNLLFVTAASISYYFIESIWSAERVLGPLYFLSPLNVFGKIILPYDSEFLTIFDTVEPFTKWMYAAIPFVCIAIAELAILLLAGIAIFNRKDSMER